ncbi:class I tRNA ligase family protein [Vibrio chagasii]|nr:class I tRNA ligase family protein [Vibrio chagasii]
MIAAVSGRAPKRLRYFDISFDNYQHTADLRTVNRVSHIYLELKRTVSFLVVLFLSFSTLEKEMFLPDRFVKGLP